jgi:hypothetical protein
MRMHWRPRHGKPFPTARELSFIEAWIKPRLETIPAVFRHPTVGVLIGGLVAFVGRDDLQVRSYGLLFIAFWLCADLWIVLLKRQWIWRFTVGWTVTSLSLIAVMGTMWWGMNEKLADQRDDVFQRLVINHHSDVGKESDVLATIFTVTNNSNYAVSGKHQLVCDVTAAVGNGQTSVLTDVWQTFTPDPVTREFKGMFGMGSPDMAWQYIAVGPPLGPNGDTETYEQCLSMARFANDTNCIDLTLIFWYSLETQPDLRQEKEYRIVGTVDGTQFVWKPQPVKSQANFCRSFYPKDYDERVKRSRRPS